MPIPNFKKSYWLGTALVVLLVLGISFFIGDAKEANLPNQVDFNYHIRPILSQNCYTCHGPDSSSREAGLRLDNFEGATALLESGNHAIVAGDAQSGSLIARLR